MSDLHLEYNTFKDVQPNIKITDSDVLILAGDVCQISKLQKLTDFLNNICKNFKYVIYILGNHEYYDSRIDLAFDKLKNSTIHLNNLYILNNDSIVINNVLFCGSTLWTDINKQNPIDIHNVWNGLNDYKYIKKSPTYQPITPYDTINLHNESVSFIDNCLSKNNFDKKVIITHHAPTSLSVSEVYKGHNLNSAYYSDLSELILTYNPILWVHGHMHTFCDYVIGATRVICNPNGYNKNPTFIPDFTITI